MGPAYLIMLIIIIIIIILTLNYPTGQMYTINVERTKSLSQRRRHKPQGSFFCCRNFSQHFRGLFFTKFGKKLVFWVLFFSGWRSSAQIFLLSIEYQRIGYMKFKKKDFWKCFGMPDTQSVSLSLYSYFFV